MNTNLEDNPSDEAAEEILDLAIDMLPKYHSNFCVDMENGHNFVTCLDCGAIWSVYDTAGHEAVDFEEIDHGDYYCVDNLNPL